MKNFKVKFDGYTLSSMKQGVFKNLELTGEDFKIDDIVIRNPQFLESPMNGVVISDGLVFRTCYNYIKQRYSFDLNSGNATVMNITATVSDYFILFAFASEGGISYIQINDVA